jgi:peptide/nickel transport system permease protein
MTAGIRIPFHGDPLAQAGTIALVVLVGFSILGLTTNIFGSPTTLGGPALSVPGPGHALGTDQLGRSLMPRLWRVST